MAAFGSGYFAFSDEMLESSSEVNVVVMGTKIQILFIEVA